MSGGRNASVGKLVACHFTVPRRRLGPAPPGSGISTEAIDVAGLKTCFEKCPFQSCRLNRCMGGFGHKHPAPAFFDDIGAGMH
jgi:hypothetical protein